MSSSRQRKAIAPAAGIVSPTKPAERPCRDPRVAGAGMPRPFWLHRGTPPSPSSLRHPVRIRASARRSHAPALIPGRVPPRDRAGRMRRPGRAAVRAADRGLRMPFRGATPPSKGVRSPLPFSAGGACDPAQCRSESRRRLRARPRAVRGPPPVDDLPLRPRRADRDIPRMPRSAPRPRDTGRPRRHDGSARTAIRRRGSPRGWVTCRPIDWRGGAVPSRRSAPPTCQAGRERSAALASPRRLAAPARCRWIECAKQVRDGSPLARGRLRRAWDRGAPPGGRRARGGPAVRGRCGLSARYGMAAARPRLANPVGAGSGRCVVAPSDRRRRRRAGRRRGAGGLKGARRADTPAPAPL